MKLATLALGTALALAGPFGLPVDLPFGLHLPTWMERWLWNPRERTERAIQELNTQTGPDSGSGEDRDAKDRKATIEKALRPAETASRLAPEDPMVQYDTGTLRLMAGKNRAAVESLDRAARNAPPRAGRRCAVQPGDRPPRGGRRGGRRRGAQTGPSRRSGSCGGQAQPGAGPGRAREREAAHQRAERRLARRPPRRPRDRTEERRRGTAQSARKRTAARSGHSAPAEARRRRNPPAGTATEEARSG